MLSVIGLVGKPTKFTMADLVTKFDQVTVSATLVCVGNRRKEQNLVKKTKGFSWGASAVGTGKYHHTCSACIMAWPVKLHMSAWAAKLSCSCVNINPAVADGSYYVLCVLRPKADITAHAVHCHLY